MAAKHITHYALEGLTREQFIILLVETAQVLNWRMQRENENIVLYAPPSAWSSGEKVTVTTEDEIATIESKNIQFQFSGAKKNNENIARLTATLDETKNRYTPGQLTEKYQALAAEQEAYAKDFEERKQSNKLTATEKVSLGLGGHYVTYTLVGLNVLIFILMAASGAGLIEFDIDSLYKWGGNVRQLTTNGEWYRLITNIFVHGGLIHVAFNMYALFYVGVYLEPLLGKWRYLTLYLACGVFASLTSIAVHDNVISVGASGAIFGLYGVFLALLTTNVLDKGTRRPMLQSIAIFIGYNLVYGVKSGVDNSAHMGGLISGAILGYAYYFIFSRKKDNPAVFITAVLAITVAAAYIMLPVINSMPKSDVIKYSDSIVRFGQLEEKALAPLHKLNDTAFSPALGEEFKTTSLPAWQQCKQLLDSSDAYKLPAETVEKKDILKKYVDLRIRQSQLFMQMETEKTNTYNDSIEANGKEIEALLASLKDKK
jgi:rhomboid protease GluP